MAFFTGCVKNEETKGDAEPTPSPTPAQTETTEDEEDPNYATVLAMWQDMDGYWVNDDGEYLQFKLDENGKAEMYAYKKDGSLDGKLKASAVMETELLIVPAKNLPAKSSTFRIIPRILHNVP